MTPKCNDIFRAASDLLQQHHPHFAECLVPQNIPAQAGRRQRLGARSFDVHDTTRPNQVAVAQQRQGGIVTSPRHPLKILGDGEITRMRKRVPLGQGNRRLDPDDPRFALAAYCRALLAHLREHADLIAVLAGESQLDSDLSNVFWDVVGDMRAGLAGWLDRAVRAGSVRPDASTTVAAHLVTSTLSPVLFRCIAPAATSTAPSRSGSPAA